LQALFPGIDLELYARSGGQSWHDWNGNGVADDPYGLGGDECLVFFLGGLFERDPRTGAYHLTGFCPDKSRPTIRTQGKPRSGPFFEFDSRRLMSREKWGLSTWTWMCIMKHDPHPTRRYDSCRTPGPAPDDAAG
jgi:hypothetical protein